LKAKPVTRHLAGVTADYAFGFNPPYGLASKVVHQPERRFNDKAAAQSFSKEFV
jgi:hypothetical protein